MDETKLKKPRHVVLKVLEHYLGSGHKFTDTPATDPTLADYERKFKKWSADAAASIRICFDPPAIAERFLKAPRRKGIRQETKIQTRYRNLKHAYEHQRDHIEQLKGTLGLYESSDSNNPEREFMLRAIELSRNCRDESDRPSPKVGAVLVKQGKIIDEAYRGELGPGDHAEYTLLEKKLKSEIVAGATLYVTLEPCTKRGPNKTPCAERIIERKIKKVVFGCIDRNPNIRGDGEGKLLDAGIEIGKFDSDLLPIIEELNREFRRLHRVQKSTKQTAEETIERGQAGIVGPSVYKIGPKRISISQLPITSPELFGREKELKSLEEAWQDSNTNVISIVGGAGAGKSALANYWLGNLRENHYGGAELVFAWSFYNQGTSDRTVSADLFIESALRWLGNTQPLKGSPWYRGEQLAQLIKEQRILLILDGLEPLQYQSGSVKGKIQDETLKTLLRELAAFNPGLCVVTTRLPIIDLDGFKGSTVRCIQLEQLSPEAGSQLLQAQGVNGDKADLEKAVENFNGHSLTLSLAGTYLNDAHQGDIRYGYKIERLEKDEHDKGNAQRVMAAYEEWFGDGPEMAVLRLLGLFDRTSNSELLLMLCAKPVIRGLNDKTLNLNETSLLQLLSKLRRAKLVIPQNSEHPTMVDVHPLVREYFGQRLKQKNSNAWKEGNNRLYNYFSQSAKKHPNTIEEMTPLYLAVTHGCQAGRYEEVLEAVYKQRILRGKDFFSIKALGTIGSDLAALSSFFEQRWSKPIAVLDSTDKNFVLGVAGLYLWGLGLLADAIQPMTTALKSFSSEGIWGGAHLNAHNLSELYISMGDLVQAFAYARQSLKFAELTDAPLEQVSGLVDIANVLHQAGHSSEAEITFQKAEAVQQQAGKDIQPPSALLYSTRGFWYCDLLLDKGKYQEVIKRAYKTLRLAERNRNLLSIALDHLSLGRAFLLQTQQEIRKDFTEAATHFNQAVKGLQQAGFQDQLTFGLLTRAKFYLVTSTLDQAQADLDEAMSIAIRAGMRLYQGDCHLVYARLCSIQGEQDEAQNHFSTAKSLFEQMGYRKPAGVSNLADVTGSFKTQRGVVETLKVDIDSLMKQVDSKRKRAARPKSDRQPIYGVDYFDHF